MRAQLIQYVDLLFAGTEGCEDVHQEILQNTLDRYDDLIMEGKAPEAAYRLAILSIGDINEIIGGSKPSPTPRAAIPTTADKKAANPSTACKKASAFSNKKWISAAVIAVFFVLGFLIAVLVLNYSAVKRSAERYPAQTHAPLQAEATEVHAEIPFYAEEAWNIRSKPSPTGEVRGIIEAGTTVYLTREETINGQRWGYIMEPEQGWIALEKAAPETTPMETSPAAAVPEETEPAPALNIFDISVEWVAGSISLIPSQSDTIRVTETGDTEGCLMETRQKNGKLSIEFCKPDLLRGLGRNLTKDLVIEVPMGWTLEELDIDATSASVNVEGLTIRKVELEAASGVCEFSNCTVDTLDVDTASGDVHFTGSLQELECDAASASFSGILNNVPKRMEMESMSGNLDLILPKNAGFTATVQGMNSDFTSDFETTVKNKAYVSGDGACRIEVNAMSGDVTIRKGLN